MHERNHRGHSDSSNKSKPEEGKEWKHLDYFKVDFKYNPKILEDILVEIQEVGDMEENVYILAFIYIHRAIFRLNSPRPDLILKMYLVSIFLAHKFLIEEEMWPLDEFATLISCRAHRLKKMEMWLAEELLDFKLAVTNEKL